MTLNKKWPSDDNQSQPFNKDRKSGTELFSEDCFNNNSNKQAKLRIEILLTVDLRGNGAVGYLIIIS